MLLPPDDWKAHFQQRARIGEVEADEDKKDKREAALVAEEQAGLADADAAVKTSLDKGNAGYDVCLGGPGNDTFHQSCEVKIQ